MNSFYNNEELKSIGFKSFGKAVFISKKCSIYSPSTISIGDNVRIDDFCILSGNITIKNNVHISAYTALFGGGEIVIGNYSGCSQRCSLISSSDDFSGEYMVGAVIPDEFKNVVHGKILLEDYVQLGANTVVLPNVVIREGAVTGAMSLVNRDLKKWSINYGIPCVYQNKRKMDLIEKEKDYKIWKSQN